MSDRPRPRREGWWDRCVLPGLLDRCMRDPLFHPYRVRAAGAAVGRTLELGCGSGLNHRYLPEDLAAEAVGLDPSARSLALARKRLGAGAALVRAGAERLPFADGRFDTVLSTFTLCSIPDVAGALAEARRVLAPGGRLVFAEHGLSPEPGIARWQRRLTPLQRALAGGCHLDRPILALLEGAGFRVAAPRVAYGPGPKPWTWITEGAAVAA